jgi:hypothetical protein
VRSRGLGHCGSGQKARGSSGLPATLGYRQLLMGLAPVSAEGAVSLSIPCGCSALVSAPGMPWAPSRASGKVLG